MPSRDGRAALIGFLQNVFQHVDHLLRVGPLELDEDARHLRRGDVDLLDHLHQLAQNVRALRDEEGR